MLPMSEEGDDLEKEMTDLTVQLVSLSQDLITAKLRLQSATSMTQVPGSQGERDMVAAVRLDTRECLQDSKVRYFHHNLLEPGQHGQDEDDDGLKQRGAERHQEKERSPERDQTSSEPLKWFGLLTPPALRQSQASFRTAVEVSVECANIQSEMTGVTNRIKFIQRRLKSTTTKQNVEELDASFSSSLKI